MESIFGGYIYLFFENNLYVFTKMYSYSRLKKLSVLDRITYTYIDFLNRGFIYCIGIDLNLFL